ncbi:MAG: hypothetical protein IPK06_02225 [Ignavibacteriae bacterium]|nr:hypothetical protein [Ignavibacteriota bacterium]
MGFSFKRRTFGLGYGISDTRFNDPLLGYFDKTAEGEIYRREKTISILAIIEETGIIGLILFLYVIGIPLKIMWFKIIKTFKDKNFLNLSGCENTVNDLEIKLLKFAFAFLNFAELLCSN